MNALLKKGVSIIALAAVVIVVSICALGTDTVYAEQEAETVSPLVVITGSGYLGNSTYTQENIGKEKTYTLEELKAIAQGDSEASADNTYMYSALNTWKNTSIYKAEGVRVLALLKDAGLNDTSLHKLLFKAPDNYQVVFDPERELPGTIEAPKVTTGITDKRYYFPNIGLLDTANMSEQNIFNAERDGEEVPAIIAWARTDNKGNTDLDKIGEMDIWNNDKVQLIVGQLSADEYNNPLWNGETSCLSIIAGSELPDVISINGKAYSRSEIMMRDYVIREYEYNKEQSGEVVSKYAKGVPAAEFFRAFNDSDIIQFCCADGYEPTILTKKELIDGNYILSYETGESKEELKPVLDTSKSDSGIKGYITLYGDRAMPVKFVNQVSVIDIPQAPVAVKAEKGSYSSIKLSWSSVDNADAYNIYRKSDNEVEYKKIAELPAGTISYTDKNLKTGTTYSYRITAVASGLESDFSATASATPTTAVPGSFKAARAGYSSIKLTWSPVSGASGYRIYQYDSKTGTYKAKKYIEGRTSGSFVISGLKTGTKYYFKIRSYRTVDGVKIDSDLSSSRYAVPSLSTPSIKKLTPGTKKVTVSWNKISGANGYKLYRATSRSGSYKLVKTTSSTSFTDRSLKKGKKYYYKLKAYRKVDGKLKYSSYSAVKYTTAK